MVSFAFILHPPNFQWQEDIIMLYWCRSGPFFYMSCCSAEKPHKKWGTGVFRWHGLKGQSRAHSAGRTESTGSGD